MREHDEAAAGCTPRLPCQRAHPWRGVHEAASSGGTLPRQLPVTGHSVANGTAGSAQASPRPRSTTDMGRRERELQRSSTGWRLRLSGYRTASPGARWCRRCCRTSTSQTTSAAQASSWIRRPPAPSNPQRVALPPTGHEITRSCRASALKGLASGRPVATAERRCAACHPSSRRAKPSAIRRGLPVTASLPAGRAPPKAAGNAPRPPRRGYGARPSWPDATDSFRRQQSLATHHSGTKRSSRTPAASHPEPPRLDRGRQASAGRGRPRRC